MKKMLLTGAMALMGLMVSAQGFMVTADIDTEDFDVSTISDNLGFGYFVNDAFAVGFSMADITTVAADTVLGTEAETAKTVFARYYWNDNVYLTASGPASAEFTDHMKLGAGYSFNAWNSLYVEPSYTMSLKEVNGDRGGAFNLGVAFRF